MNITDILEDSPNGYEIAAQEPRKVDEAIHYYLVILDQFSIEEYPVEFGLVNYCLAKLLLGDKSRPKFSEERAKRIENALYHFNQSLQVFDYRDYPTMYAVISIMMGRLFRERATLISNRSFLADRSTQQDSIQFGLDQVLEAFPIFARTRVYQIEHALCCLEAGWLYVLQSEFLENFKDDLMREQAATYLERAVDIAQKVLGKGDKLIEFTVPGEKSRTFNPLGDTSDLPHHLQLLLEKFPFSYIEGSATYLLGRLYQGWIPAEPGTRDPDTGKDLELSNMEKSLNYFSSSVGPSLLPRTSPLWGDAHHRAALVLIKYPHLVNPDFVGPGKPKNIESGYDLSPNRRAPPSSTNATALVQSNPVMDNTANNASSNNSDLHLQIAISHLGLALRCDAVTNVALMDIHFHYAQTAIARLQLIIDGVPLGHSVTRTIAQHSEGLDLISAIEEHLQAALQRVTPASTQTAQDAYLYFFSCLKISEYRMLEAACKPQLQPVEREDHLRDSVEYLIDSLVSRTLVDNMDLHFISTVQMSQLLLAVKRYFAATKSYAKALFTLSLIINRSLYNPEVVIVKLGVEIMKQVGQALLAGARDIKWVKLHFGPVSLNERVTAGYASWSFEEAPSEKRPSIKRKDNSSNSLLMPLDTSVYRPKGGGKIGEQVPDFGGAGGGIADDESLAESSRVTSSVLPAYKASPPKGVPPLNLPAIKSKKVYVTGEEMPATKPPDRSIDGDRSVLGGGGGASMYDGATAATGDGTSKFPMKKKPPPGPVPLFALGHHPVYKTGDTGSAAAAAASKKQGVGSYGGMGMGEKHAEEDSRDETYYAGPYSRRLRRRIPHVKLMLEIDKSNLNAYGFRNGQPVFLLPRHIRRPYTERPKPSLPPPGSKTVPVGAPPSYKDTIKQEKSLKKKSSLPAVTGSAAAASKPSKKLFGRSKKANSGNADDDDDSEHKNAHDNSDDDEDDDNAEGNEEDDDDEEEGFREEEGSDDDDEGSDVSALAMTEFGGDPSTAKRPHKDSNTKPADREIVTRNRSKRISPPNAVAAGDATVASHLSANKKSSGPIQRESVVTWLLGGSKESKAAKAAKKAAKVEEKRRKKAAGWSLFGGKKAAVAEEDEDLLEGNGFWASPQCYYTFMILSRQSRMQLVLRSSRLLVLEGERASYSMYRIKPKYTTTFYTLRTRLVRDCAKLVIPPTTLKELGQRSFLELQQLFTSQAKVCNRLDDQENLMYYKISKMDSFLPFVSTVPVFLRDIASYDEALLNAERLIMNISNEQAVTKYAEKLKEKEKHHNSSHHHHGGGEGKNSQGGYDYDSVSAATTETPGGMAPLENGPNALNMRELKAALTKQEQDEREEVAVGKMTLSLSHSLDGGNYLRDGQQGTRDFLEKHLAADECMLIWHLPAVPTQTLQVVIVWRGNSASLYADLSASKGRKRAKDMAEQGSTKRPSTAANTNNKKKNKKGKDKTSGKDKEEDTGHGIVMEIAKSDMEASHLMQYIQGYLDALHAESAPQRATLTTDALRALSCALSLTEFLHMIPPHVRSLVICCPPAMRLIPWHLLLIEQPNNQPFTVPVTSPPGSKYGSFGVDMNDVKRYMEANPKGSGGDILNVQNAVDPPEGGLNNNGGSTEIHLLEKFSVRLGPSLALFELNETGGKQLRHSVGLHRLIAVDGEAEHPDRSPGIRGTDLEVACVCHTWSADPDDSHVLQNESAVPRAVQTVLFGNENDEAYAKFKEEIFLRRRVKTNHIKIVRRADDFDAAIAAKVGSSPSASLKKSSAGGAGAAEGVGEGESTEQNEQKQKKKKLHAEKWESDDENDDDESSSDSDESDENDEESDGLGGRKKGIKMKRRKRKIDMEMDFDMKFLTMCRVLHVAAPKVPLSVPEEQRLMEKLEKEEAGEATGPGAGAAEDDPLEAAIELPQFDRLLNYRNPKMKKRIKQKKRTLLQQYDDERNTLSSRDIIRQVFVKNCALSVLSRFGLCDDVPDIKNPEKCDSNCEFIEALHLAGSKAVLYPLWSGSSQSGITTLAHLVFIIRFYSVLPNYSKAHRSVVETVRRTQVWLRNATADDVIAFIHKAPIPSKARKVIIEEMEAYVDASLTAAQRAQKKEALKKLEVAKNLAAADGVDYMGNNNNSNNNNNIDDGDTDLGGTEASKSLASGPSFILPAINGTAAAGAAATGAAAVGVSSNEASGGGIGGSSPEKLGNRVGGNHKFFKHFLNWGAFTVSGIGGNVHHPELTEDQNEGMEGHIGWDDKELNNMIFEASVLRREGRIKDAQELEKLIRQLQIARIKKGLNKARETGKRAGRGIMDTLDYLDKALLDQDSDEISVSDDSAEERKRLRKIHKNKARESDSDEYSLSEDSVHSKPPPPSASASATPQDGNNFSSPDNTQVGTNSADRPRVPNTPGSTRSNARFKPMPLDIGSMKAEDIAYSKWKSKVFGLNMDVKQPVIPTNRPLSRANSRINRTTDADARDTGKGDNYEYNMLKKVADSANPTDAPEDYDARMERLYQKKQRAKERRQAAAAAKAGNDGSDDGSNESDDSDESGRKAGDKKLKNNADYESESDYEDSSDDAEEDDDDDSDDSGNNDGDPEGLYATRKKLRKKKRDKHKRKKLTRFQKALQEVRGNVRSYGDTVKMLSAVPEKKIKKLKPIAASIKKKSRYSGGKGEDEDGGVEGKEEDEEEGCIIS